MSDLINIIFIILCILSFFYMIILTIFCLWLYGKVMSLNKKLNIEKIALQVLKTKLPISELPEELKNQFTNENNNMPIIPTKELTPIKNNIPSYLG